MVGNELYVKASRVPCDGLMNIVFCPLNVCELSQGDLVDASFELCIVLSYNY